MRIHEDVYHTLGFQLVPVGPGNLADRGNEIKAYWTSEEHTVLTSLADPHNRGFE